MRQGKMQVQNTLNAKPVTRTRTAVTPPQQQKFWEKTLTTADFHHQQLCFRSKCLITFISG
jgi:hypothetical protein